MDLAARIRALEAIEAIRRLKHDYFHYCDSKQPDKVRECFAPGPVHIDYGRIGTFDNREALVAVFTQLACHPHMVEMHHAQNPRIDLIDEDHARGVWSLYYQLIDTRSCTLTQLGARYDDEYRRLDGRWVICATVCSATSTLICDLDGEAAKVLFAGIAPAQDTSP